MKKIEIQENDSQKKSFNSDFAKKLEKAEEEWRARLIEKEKEWKKLLEKIESDKFKLQEEVNHLKDSKYSLENALQSSEGKYD